MPKPPTSTKPQTDSELEMQFSSAKNSMVTFREQWETFLDTAYARITQSNGYKSRVREGSLSTLLWDRTARVVAQLPTGRIQCLDQDDIGKSKLMDLVWHKYVMQGANTDYSFFTKLRMWDYYSMVYGAAPALYDYRIDDEYIGPDWTVVDPRYVFPQGGKLSFQRCKYVFIEAYHNLDYVKSKKGQAGWNQEALNYIISNYKEGSQPDNSRRTTNLQMDRGQTTDLHKGEIQLVTKYERGKNGHWITFAPQYDNKIVRDISNPHESGRLPVVFKFCFPLLDSLWGMGDVERGQSLQNAIDSFVNLSMDFAKFKLYPPLLYGTGVNASQLRYEPAAKWKVNKDDVAFMELSGNYSQEMTNGVQFLKGALQTQNGTTNTDVTSAQGNLDQGKTPEAIAKNNAKENSRDNWDRSMLEEAYSELANGMINLIGTKQPASIEFHIFDDDIKSIYDAGGKDVLEIFESAKKPKITEDGELDWELSGKGAAKLTIGPDDIKGAYRYIMDTGTTMASDDEEEAATYDALLEVMGTPVWQQFTQGLQQSGRTFDYGDFAKKYLIAKGVQDWEELVPEQQPSAQPFNPSMLQSPQAQQLMAGQSGAPQGAAPQGAPTSPQQDPNQVAQDQADALTKTIEDKATEMAKTMMAQKGKAPQELISYKDASPLTKAHMEIAAGFTPDPVHQLEEQALMAGHAATTVNHNIQMQTPLPDPNMQPTDAAQSSPQPTNEPAPQQNTGVAQ